MGDTMKKVRSGDPLAIPASTYNSFIDATRDYQQRQRNAGQFPQATKASAETVLVKNNSGADVQRFNILGIDGILFDPAVDLDRFKNSPVLIGVTPSQTNHTGKFVILAEPVRDGAIGRATITGICCVQVNVASESNNSADVAEGQSSYLQSGASGSAVILWKESGTGVKWALIKLAGGGSGAGIILWRISGFVTDWYAYYKCRPVYFDSEKFLLSNQDPTYDDAGDNEVEVLNIAERGESAKRSLSVGDFLVGYETNDDAGNLIRVGWSPKYAWIHI